MRPDIFSLAKTLWKDDLQRQLHGLALKAKEKGLKGKDLTEYVWSEIYLAAQDAKIPGWRGI